MDNARITISDICEGILGRNPEFYHGLSAREKALQGIVLGMEGKYFDIAGGKVKSIPEGYMVRIGENGNPIILNKEEP